MVMWFLLNAQFDMELLLCGLLFGNIFITSTGANTPGADFPASFQFGVATAAYQIEGGWNEDGKGPSIWDTGVHDHPGVIADGTNGDVADDSYHLIDRDVELLKDLGVNFYRFSISWSRILPTGDVSSLNGAGILYYNRLIDKLLANSIEPMVTMYHYDLPAELQKLGGMANSLFPNYFEQYAKVLFAHFGDRVKLWVTFNEPVDYCVPGYGKGTQPPFVNASGVGEYLCLDNTIKAHALAFHMYKALFFKKQGGKVGIVGSSRYFFSKSNDTDLVDRGIQYFLGWLTHPIYSQSGGYPEVMIQDIASNSQAEGRAWSRLPSMDENWLPFIKGSADFFGLNYYTSRYVELNPPPFDKAPSWENDSRLNCTIDASWKRGSSKWMYHVPQGLGGLLRWIKDQYNNVEVYVTENGWSDDGQLLDEDRILSLTDHLREVSNAIQKYGCKVSGYAHWSLMDNFEWLAGYTERFGLSYVNITSPERTRIPKKSWSVYKEIIATKRIKRTDS